MEKIMRRSQSIINEEVTFDDSQQLVSTTIYAVSLRMQMQRFVLFQGLVPKS